MKKIILLCTLLSALICGSTLFSLAQVATTLKMSPENPEPKSSVKLTFNSFSFNASTAMITWIVNGKKAVEGQGITTFTIKTGVVGEVTTIQVNVTTSDGFSTSQVIDVTPSSVLLLAEAPKSYVPILYEGRSLPGEGGIVQVTAFPSIGDEGKLVDPTRLSYSWYVNDKIFKEVSGLAKQSARIRLDYLQTKNTIKVVVRSPYGNYAEKSISIAAHAVMPVLYTYDSILGVDFTRAVEKRFETVKEFTLSLEPFYVSDEEKKRATYTWYLDRLPTTPLGGRLLSLQPKENSFGTKLLSIDVFGTDKRLQKANVKTEIIFDTRK